MKRKSASITVEAALVLPIFIYAVVAFLYFIQIMLLQETIQSAITEVGKYVSKYAYIYNYVTEHEEDSNTLQSSNEAKNSKSDIQIRKNNSSNATIIDTLIAKSMDSLFLKQKIKDFLNENTIDNSCIVNGFSGLNLYQSSIMENEDDIDIIVLYKIRLPILFFNSKDMSMVQRVKLRGWTGYNPKENNNETGKGEEADGEIVYITQTGTVYHFNKECTHLKLSIKKALYSDIKDLRNTSGGKYKSCEVCDNDKNMLSNTTVYLTDTGDRYHSSLKCSGLKRSIISILISEVGNRTPCQRCSNESTKTIEGGE